MSLIEDLVSIVGETDVLVGEEVSQRPAFWGSTAPSQAICIARPQTTAQVSEILQLCSGRKQPVVTQGGMTGLVRGSVAASDEVVVSLERMNRIEGIAPGDRTVLAQAGVPLQAVQETAKAEGFLFPLDFGARGSATIGGAISTNAGGNRVIRYGMTRNLVLGLEAVLADGTIVSSLNRMLKNNAGYDLKQLFIGTEGTLGIVTRAVLRIFPRPASENLALVAVQEFDQLPTLLNRIDRDLAGTLSAFEVMWKDFYDLATMEGGRHAPLAPGQPFYVLIEALGSDAEKDSDRFETILYSAQAEGLLVDGVIAMSSKQREEIWAVRDGVGFLRLGPVFVFDVSLRISDMKDYVDQVMKSTKSAWPEASVIPFGHLGDGNLHFAIDVGSDTPETRARVEEMVYSPLSRIGGSVSAEHGIGTEKRKYLRISRSHDEIRTMRLLKQALDPKGILNPGRVFSLDEQG
jgi:FAD/FMN-containing dehydrogenase